MIEFRLSLFKPGKAISSSTQQFYHIYKDGKLVDRTLYSFVNLGRSKYKGIIIVLKRTISEISPRVFCACREHNKHYPRYCMDEDLVVVSGKTGKIILDTHTKLLPSLQDTPKIISDYMFRYNNTLYDNEGNIIKHFSNGIQDIMDVDNFYIVRTKEDRKLVLYVFSKFGKLVQIFE